MRICPAIVLSLLIISSTLAQQGGVLNSPHNLSTSGPGALRASSEQEVCIFCHTPHNAAPIQPLWNRSSPVNSYRVYTSNSLQATPGQPTGTSKLCLSCHDGTIALGAVISRDTPIAMAGGVTNLPTGATNIGTDLSDDHPISFKYDSALVQKNVKIKDPALLPTDVKLDSQSELQCTSCHDAHNNQFGKFLVKSNANSELCNSCHSAGTTTVANHVNCSSCHQQHNAPSGPYLLKQAKVTDTCLTCHNGGTTLPQGTNIAADLRKLSIHDTSSATNLPNPIPANVNCADCHEPHTMTSAVGLAPNLPGRFGAVSGVNKSGTTVKNSQFEYEVCFKCHADKSAVAPKISRKIVQSNFRLKMDPTAISFHPVEAVGKSTNVPSLLTGMTTASVIYCNDCHNSDSGHKAGGAGPDGVHGSANASLLVAKYVTTDRTSESAANYALCYKCHDRNSILNDRSFKKHHEHISDQRTPCSVCHDPHGISSAQGTTAGNARLINFDTTVVLPDTKTKRLEFLSTGTNKGSCYLTCHGKAHSPLSY